MWRRAKDEEEFAAVERIWDGMEPTRPFKFGNVGAA
jgi:hypothetical protein